MEGLSGGAWKCLAPLAFSVGSSQEVFHKQDSHGSGCLNWAQLQAAMRDAGRHEGSWCGMRQKDREGRRVHDILLCCYTPSSETQTDRSANNRNVYYYYHYDHCSRLLRVGISTLSFNLQHYPVIIPTSQRKKLKLRNVR